MAAQASTGMGWLQQQTGPRTPTWPKVGSRLGIGMAFNGINSDYGYCRAMGPDMALSSNPGLDNSMVPGYSASNLT